MTVVKHTEPPHTFTGLSSDSKPDAPDRSVFYELDTGIEDVKLSAWVPGGGITVDDADTSVLRTAWTADMSAIHISHPLE
jgi:hypothetical protein